MRVVTVLQQPDDDQISTLVAFVERVTAAQGTRPLSDHLWLDLRAGGSGGVVAVTIADETGLVGMAQISAAIGSTVNARSK